MLIFEESSCLLLICSGTQNTGFLKWLEKSVSIQQQRSQKAAADFRSQREADGARKGQPFLQSASAWLDLRAGSAHLVPAASA